MKYILLIIFLICTSLFSQNKNYSYTVENLQTLTKFLNDNKVRFDAKELATLGQLADWINFYNKKKLIVPSVYFFDGNGERIIEDFNAESCGQVLKGINSLDKIKTYKKDKTDNLQNWLAELDFAFTNENPLTEPFDLYVIILYGKMVKNKSSNDTAFNWYNSIKSSQNHNVKIKPILVSIDLLDSWKISNELKKQIGFN